MGNVKSIATFCSLDAEKHVFQRGENFYQSCTCRPGRPSFLADFDDIVLLEPLQTLALFCLLNGHLERCPYAEV